VLLSVVEMASVFVLASVVVVSGEIVSVVTSEVSVDAELVDSKKMALVCK